MLTRWPAWGSVSPQLNCLHLTLHPIGLLLPIGKEVSHLHGMHLHSPAAAACGPDAAACIERCFLRLSAGLSRVMRQVCAQIIFGIVCTCTCVRVDLHLACRWFPEHALGGVPEAKYLDVILYSREQLVKEHKAMPSKGDADALPHAPWGIISIKAQDEDHETPMQVWVPVIQSHTLAVIMAAAMRMHCLSIGCKGWEWQSYTLSMILSY